VSIFIRAHSEDGVSAALEYKRQQSDRDAGLGCVLAQGVGPGVVDVIVSSRDYEDGITTIELRRGVLSEVTAVMGAAKREVECLVTVVDDDGAPIVGAVVAIAEISAAKPVQSDARGVARLLLRDGTDYEIVVRRKGYGAEFLFLAGGEPTARAVLKPPEEY
ncbi:MAG: carboxypeptidase-like regulatory domain-containing protein, partial [Planctomycetota bacterium]